MSSLGRAGQGKGKGVLASESEQLFSYVTHCIFLIHIDFRFHEDIPYGYLIMACTRTALEIYQRDVTLIKWAKKNT